MTLIDSIIVWRTAAGATIVGAMGRAFAYGLVGAVLVGGTLAATRYVETSGRSAPAESAPAAVIVMPPEVEWAPDPPGEGELFVVRLRASEHTPIAGAHGSVAGEELHFRRVSERVLESLAPVPVGSDDAIEVAFRVVYRSGEEERFSRTIPVARGTYRHEALSVAPRFGSPLGEADQARLARDQEMARGAALAAHRTPPIWSDQVVMPRTSRVTSGFGDGRVFNGQVSSRHMGLDLQGFQGDTVVAAARGVVALVEPFLLAGNIVYLNHGAGLLTAYFHLSEQLVQVGDTVEAGDPIGRVGATGRVTGPHLHWVARYGTTSVDPRSLLTVLGPR